MYRGGGGREGGKLCIAMTACMCINNIIVIIIIYLSHFVNRCLSQPSQFSQSLEYHHFGSL